MHKVSILCDFNQNWGGWTNTVKIHENPFGGPQTASCVHTDVGSSKGVPQAYKKKPNKNSPKQDCQYIYIYIQLRFGYCVFN